MDILGPIAAVTNKNGMESNNYAGPNNGSENNGGPPLSRQTSTSSTAEQQRDAAVTNEDGVAAAAATNNTTNTATNNATAAAPSSSTSNENKFEASLLLGIAENIIGIPGVDEDGNPKREPGSGDLSTLPSSMTSFLDVLTEDQRRKRHRHIPAVEGFRRLYKNEIKVDMVAARMLHRKRKVFDPNANNVEDNNTVEDNETAAAMMEGGEEEDIGTLDEVMSGGEETNHTATTSSSDNDIIARVSDKDTVPDKMAFIVPSEDALSLANGGRLASLLKRWEANPSEVEIDLSNYRKTVQRTRKELQAAENERGRIELVSAVMREHFQKHLIAYKEEIMAVYDQLLETNMGCLKAEERYNIFRSMSLRGSGKSMKDVLVTLTALEDELKNVSEGGGGSGGGDGSNVTAALPSEKSADWRVPGLGGVSTPGSKAEMASGWILEGDNVITPSGEEGEVIEVKVTPALDDAAAEKKKGEAAEKPDFSSDKKQGEDAMDVDKPKEEEKKESAEKLAKSNDGMKSADAYALVEKISVRLSNGDAKVFKSAELKFNPKKLPTLTHFNKALGKRWSAMLKTAEAGTHSHDLSAMDNYFNSTFATDDSEDGNDTNSDDCLVAPFGSDMMAAPDSVRAFPSVIPPETLEETVRKVVYEITTPRIIPDIPADLKKYESQKEDLNRYQARVMQLRHRLGRQKRLRRLNERTLTEGKSRSHKVENLLLEMQMDLKNLKERLHGELSELGISNAVLWNGADENSATRLAADADPTVAEIGLINNVETTLEPESKRLRVE